MRLSPFPSLAVPQPFLSSDRDYTTRECWSAGLEMWGGVLLGPLWPWCWLNMVRTRSSGSNQRTARLHCPAELSTVELWTLNPNPSLVPPALCMYISAWVGQVTQSCTHVTHLLFSEHTSVLHSPVVQRRLTAALHVSAGLFFFMLFFWSLLLPVTHLFCLFILVDDSCHFHFCGECDIWLTWQCLFLITDIFLIRFFFPVVVVVNEIRGRVTCSWSSKWH